MKITVSFDLDLTESPTYNAQDVAALRNTIQNIGSFVHGTSLYYHDRKLKFLASKLYENDKAMHDALEEKYEEEIQLAHQIFNNLIISGITDDGHAFQFSHREPGYKERLIVDGVEGNTW